ncbi:cupin domain-containing protein [Winogradskyella alexanderae]|uniref:Cupin domain-containing protein n=1 Tax=Winogradskyella alexanderae TaxID=2877123 RepID=A0ABS7XRS7_9FLAO|nr:cupin domain-containing protein [Winogradskyella alexanderae]MCA0131736.1 cupin domain-containing protein [Winogradskyella alexanderae]
MTNNAFDMVNINNQIKKLHSYYSPKIIAKVNNEYVKIAKINGDKVPWHSHENEDELFYILEGSLVMELEHQEPFIMQEGDVFVVPKSVNHKVSSKNECAILLIESKTTLHTGNVISEITKSINNQKK